MLNESEASNRHHALAIASFINRSFAIAQDDNFAIVFYFNSFSTLNIFSLMPLPGP